MIKAKKSHGVWLSGAEIVYEHSDCSLVNVQSQYGMTTTSDAWQSGDHCDAVIEYSLLFSLLNLFLKLSKCGVR